MGDPTTDSGTAQATIPEQSPGENQASPEVTYTKAEVDAKLTAAGRSDKQFDAREASLKASEEASETRRREWSESQEEKLRDDPDGLRDFRAHERAEKTLRENETLKRDNERLQRDNEAAQERDNGTEKQTNANTIAAKHGVSAATLLESTDGSTAAMEKLAKQLRPVGEAQEPYSGITEGGGSTTEGEIMDAYNADPKNPAARAAYNKLREDKGWV